MHMPLVTFHYRMDNRQPQPMTWCLFVKPQSPLAQL